MRTPMQSLGEMAKSLEDTNRTMQRGLNELPNLLTVGIVRYSEIYDPKLMTRIFLSYGFRDGYCQPHNHTLREEIKIIGSGIIAYRLFYTEKLLFDNESSQLFFLIGGDTEPDRIKLIKENNKITPSAIVTDRLEIPAKCMHSLQVIEEGFFTAITLPDRTSDVCEFQGRTDCVK